MAKDEAKKETKRGKAEVSKVKRAVDKKKDDTKKVPSSKKVSAKKTVKKDVKESTESAKKKTETVKKATKASSAKKLTNSEVKSTKTDTKKPKSVSKSTSSKAKTSTTKKASSRTKTNLENKSTAKPMLAEYYDLPYRYNKTIVKILAQTPTTLFVYWDISDNDRNALISKHGDNFFYETKPILIVHNITHNYSFEIDINDFANSWYIRTQEPNCDYMIELGRKYFSNNDEYIFINSSNGIVSPNDHILFENTNLGNVLFKNVKTNAISSKDFGSLRFINDMDKLYGNIYDVYSALYSDGLLNELTNPSSGEFYLKK